MKSMATISDPNTAPSRETSRALCGWSPPATAADTSLKRAVDRFMPRTGISVLLYFGSIAALMAIAPALPRRGELIVDGAAALAAAAWCGLNLWRCGHAHCAVTTPAWSLLALFDFGEAVLGRSLIHGDEQLVFLVVLLVSLAFEGAWYLARGTNAVAAPQVPASRS